LAPLGRSNKLRLPIANSEVIRAARKGAPAGEIPIEIQQITLAQRLVRYLTHFADGFQVGCSESVLDPGGK
jgi:hypothetical protein